MEESIENEILRLKNEIDILRKEKTSLTVEGIWHVYNLVSPLCSFSRVVKSCVDMGVI